ncbi:hypothetical protein [Rhizohabitans arisaemae]|uniref:hypothetical protein n=1 Tax=Rhizohabitans arisaemae TaxID=2720610 RepID=UPI0024B1FA5A|nr:hypothetical protein [Rhizohabitans arisaemae]
MPVVNWTQVAAAPTGWSVPGGAWSATLLICLSTLAGAWLARRDSARVATWLAIASAIMLTVAVADLLPHAWMDAVEAGVPIWLVAIAAVTGFLVLSYFTRDGCGDENPGGRRVGEHAPGRHRRLRKVLGAALFGGAGTAIALTAHRAIEGATVALSLSVVMTIALVIHSAGEGLALTALLTVAKQRVSPWLATACLSPAVGALVATVAPIPAGAVPILLGVVGGVLLRTAMVGIKLAAHGERGGRLSRSQLAIAVVVAVTVGALLASTAHGVSRQDPAVTGGPAEPTSGPPRPGGSGPTLDVEPIRPSRETIRRSVNGCPESGVKQRVACRSRPPGRTG